MIRNPSQHPTVAEIEAVQRESFTRSSDRPQGRVRVRSRMPDDVRKAKDRLRTAAWRKDLDAKGKPESSQVATQLLVSLIGVARRTGMQVQDMPETKAAFADMFDAMEQRGFRRAEVEAVVRRITRRAE